ncbi:RcnB family protein [Sphingobium sp. AN641]|uniref:RcnB family protein n=1 Tax=Sphingobium sp. AN641 TaxID=3133443 RepID=UPI0030C26B30
MADFKKWMLAGLMTATTLGSIAPAYAQRGENERGNARWSQQRDAGQQRAQRQQERADYQRPVEVRQRAQVAAQQRAEARQRVEPQRQQRQVQRVTAPAAAIEARRDQRQDWRQAQRDDRQDGRQDRREDRRDWRQDQRGDRQDRRVDRRDERRDDRRDWRNDNRPGNRDWSNNRRFDDRTRWTNQRRWDNGWRNDRRYDWQSNRSRFGDRYRAGRYYAPRGWDYGYRRFSVGIVLSSLLYSNNYWLDDTAGYRLPPAYGSLRWVRYYDDALLVDTRDGYVVDVIHDFFW